MKRRTIPWLTALFFITILSCDKNKLDPECKDASCRDPEWNEYVEYLIDEPVALSGPPFFAYSSVRFTKKFPSNSDGHYEVDRASICTKSLAKIEGFPLTFTNQKNPDSFPYKVSGKLLDYTGEKLVFLPILTLYIDKIEKIKP
jgi:hypothetical protein